MRMSRLMGGVYMRRERQHRSELGRRLGLETIDDTKRRCRPGWHGHAERKSGADWVKADMKLVMEGMAPAAAG